MSKRKQTENLHLYAYELTTGLPTFLKDWSDNMTILDSAHSAVLSLIGALDDRLTTAEGTLEDLSPESIQDYKIRLDALEKKVVINTNGIKDVNTKIATVNAQINTINAEQIVQNNRLTVLETLGVNHTELINALRTDLTSVGGRVTTLEQCCENVQHEIADMQHDIDGFNDDVTALATQVSTLSHAVTELTELVNSLQLDVVSQRLDSFEASLTALTDRVTTAENNIVAQGSTLEEHNTRITANENNIENIDTEIGDTDYSEIGDSVSASLVELANRIRALTPQEYNVLIARLNTVETEVSDIEDTVDGLSNDVNGVQTNVATLQGVTDNIVSVIPDTASSENKLLTSDAQKTYYLHSLKLGTGHTYFHINIISSTPTPYNDVDELAQLIHDKGYFYADVFTSTSNNKADGEYITIDTVSTRRINGKSPSSNTGTTLTNSNLNNIYNDYVTPIT